MSVLKSASSEYMDKNCDIEFTNHSIHSETDEEEEQSHTNNEVIQDTVDDINVDDINVDDI